MLYGLILIALIIVIGVVVFKLKKQPKKSRAERLGEEGERRLIKEYQQHFSAPYDLINNCTLADEANGSTQIDHIILSPYGIFVLESKNYSGWIFGEEKQKQWTQVLYQKKYTFQNPLLQNYKHVKVLEKLLEIPFSQLHSVVVFSEKSEFKTVMPNNVLQGVAWVSYVKGFQQKIFSEAQLKQMQRTLSQKRMADNARTQRLHVQNLKNKKPT